jgi:hypothetical protein
MNVNQERWDVVLTILSGPLRSSAESVYRGPIVRIGHNPGPGGVQLGGYRGLDARQCTITAYDGGSAEICPVGSNQVRIAPHANVNWKDIDPINGPTFLSNGCAFHIGPVNRGATMRFVECRRLGVWEGGSIQSNVDRSLGQGGQPIVDPHRVGRVRTTFMPMWVLGCLTTMLGSTASVIVAITLIVVSGPHTVPDLGPEASSTQEYFKSVPMDVEPDAKLLKGLEQPMAHFVMNPNRHAAEGRHDELEEPKNWDKTFQKYVARSVELHIRQRPFFKNLDERRVEWSRVVQELRKAGMPDVFAAIPYQESRYRSSAQSFVCAKGYWQFMPETANRVDKHYGEEFRVRGCRLRGRGERFTPTAITPPFTRNAVYVQDNSCLIPPDGGCEIDDRTDLMKSTRAAILTLGEAWNHPTLRSSGALVQTTILSHNAGANDEEFGKRKRFNLVPAMEKWIDDNGERQAANFYGQNILCEGHAGNEMCGSLLMPETQHYAYNIVAQHFIAVCYYAQEYPSDPAFREWQTWNDDNSYCSAFNIPSKSEVQGW